MTTQVVLLCWTSFMLMSGDSMMRTMSLSALLFCVSVAPMGNLYVPGSVKNRPDLVTVDHEKREAVDHDMIHDVSTHDGSSRSICRV